jgi:hypothetical protein
MIVAAFLLQGAGCRVASATSLPADSGVSARGSHSSVGADTGSSVGADTGEDLSALLVIVNATSEATGVTAVYSSGESFLDGVGMPAGGEIEWVLDPGTWTAVVSSKAGACAQFGPFVLDPGDSVEAEVTEYPYGWDEELRVCVG